MKDSILIEGREFISVGRAAEITKYTKDYVGQLCRGGKIAARMVGRTWFIDRESLTLYKTTADTFFANHGKQKDMVIPPAVVEAPRETARSEGSSGKAPQEKSVDLGITYIPDIRPLMPELNKASLAPVASRETKRVPAVKIAAPVAVSENLIRIQKPVPVASRQSVSMMRNTFVAALVLVAIVSGSAAMFYAYERTNSSQLSMDVQATNMASVSSVVGSISDFIKGIFGLETRTLATNIEKPPPQPGGIAIVPSSNSKTQDELIKQKIQGSFSDEVRVTPDQSGTAGVITPVFRKATGDSFVYVLVPVKDQSKNQ